MLCVPRTKRGTSPSLGRDVLKHLSPLNEARAMHDFKKKVHHAYEVNTIHIVPHINTD